MMVIMVVMAVVMAMVVMMMIMAMSMPGTSQRQPGICRPGREPHHQRA